LLLLIINSVPTCIFYHSLYKWAPYITSWKTNGRKFHLVLVLIGRTPCEWGIHAFNVFAAFLFLSSDDILSSRSRGVVFVCVVFIFFWFVITGAVFVGSTLLVLTFLFSIFKLFLVYFNLHVLFQLFTCNNFLQLSLALSRNLFTDGCFTMNHEMLFCFSCCIHHILKNTWLK
jgi:hypothetical protein